ncbi:hypothetical protein J6590_081256 [Homalodisca vitripennis]|nr:hypothetical protein J6590_081256 [Homalodisca vitripennis]
MARTVCRLINMEIDDELRDQLSSIKFNIVTNTSASHDIFPRLSTHLHSPQTIHFCFLAQTADYDIERQSVVTGHTVTVTVCRSIYPILETLTR